MFEGLQADRRLDLAPGNLLPRDYYARTALEVGPDLIGKLFVRRLGDEILSGWIVETEAYMGSDDPASHAYRGLTGRNHTMFGSPGHLYVYRSYGVHFCANVVTGQEGVGTAILLRALEPRDGLTSMRIRRGLQRDRLLCSGPGRLCQALAISASQDGADLCDDECFIVDADRTVDIKSTRRIGISIAVDRPWRFVQVGSSFLSRNIQSADGPVAL